MTPCKPAQRHDARREASLAGHAQHHLHGGVGQQAGQIGGGGNAGAHAQPRKRAARLVAGEQLAVEADVRPTGIIASGPFISPVGKPSSSSGMPG